MLENQVAPRSIIGGIVAQVSTLLIVVGFPHNPDSTGYGGLCFGSGVLDPPIKSMWGDWYLQFPIIGPLNMGKITSPDGVLIVPGTLPGTPPAPYSIPMQGLIGDALTNMCVLEVK